MRGILVLGLLASVALIAAPSASAQTEQVASTLTVNLEQAIAGSPLDIGTGSFANLAIQFCYGQGGAAPNPQDNKVLVTITITQQPEWAGASLSHDSYEVEVQPGTAASNCLPSPAIQIGVPALDASKVKGGEAGTIDISVAAEVPGAPSTIKAPDPVTASTQIAVATPDTDILATLNENSSAATEDDLLEAASEETGDSPGFDVVMPVAIGVAVLVVAARRRRSG